jgi:hypothetical protein
MGKMYSIVVFAGLAVGGLVGCGTQFMTSNDWCVVGGVALLAAGVVVLGLIAFTVGTGWILLLKSMLRRLRAN